MRSLQATPPSLSWRKTNSGEFPVRRNVCGHWVQRFQLRHWLNETRDGFICRRREEAGERRDGALGEAEARAMSQGSRQCAVYKGRLNGDRIIEALLCAPREIGLPGLLITWK